MMYELPPQIGGTAEMIALRDYLVRLAKELDKVGETAEGMKTLVTDTSNKLQREAVKSIQDQAQNLKALIIKNADQITEYADSRFDSLSSLYVAISDYGNYYEQIETNVQQTARETVETYHYTESIEALESYMTDLNGQIRRGLIEDPDTHETHLGIAISENLSFTGNTTEVGGVTYYELADHQTFGLYTSTGWQFWIDGQKMGWFSSQDSMLHLANIVVEHRIQLGSDWQITASNGFGIRYIGA